jgi:acetoin utilization deacetylase AcuC-like enzyme
LPSSMSSKSRHTPAFATPRPYEIGRRLAAIDCPVLVCQEGGYNLEVLGQCVHRLLCGLADSR